ncbi:hypothetical protein [Actinopolymorpha sp. B9G3]|uniref:hypothetical protein n=1 Tax=Actinopolymorpha sp. B9G3 TaxID=3158970 RepID=UPI0032D98AE2
MLRSLEVPDESALAATLTTDLADQLPANVKVVPWRRGADFFVFRVCSVPRQASRC